MICLPSVIAGSYFNLLSTSFYSKILPSYCLMLLVEPTILFWKEQVSKKWYFIYTDILFDNNDKHKIMLMLMFCRVRSRKRGIGYHVQ